MTRFIKPDEMTPLERMTAFSKGQLWKGACCLIEGERRAGVGGLLTR